MIDGMYRKSHIKNGRMTGKQPFLSSLGSSVNVRGKRSGSYLYIVDKQLRKRPKELLVAYQLLITKRVSR